MVVIANQEELDWLFDALGAASLCLGCPARAVCTRYDEAEEAVGAPVEDRMSCGEMQRAVIQVMVTDATAQLKQGERNAGEE